MAEQGMLRNDLKSLDPKDFYLKHIVKSHNWYFSDYLHIPQDELVDRMDFFKEIVSTKMNINFHSLQIVGSAKTGYSLSPKKLLKPFHDETPGVPSSDIDIAIISDRLFQSFWGELRKKKGLWNQHYYGQLTESIFRGYINDKDLLKIPGPRERLEGLVNPINMTLQELQGQ